jgi:hypothetical protein
MGDYPALFDLAARYLEGALYLSEAKRLRRLAQAPIFSGDEAAVEIIARYSAELEEALDHEAALFDPNAIRRQALAELRGTQRG